jgi:predicted RNA-binding protein with PIN domain
MIVVVDGYNLIKYVLGSTHVSHVQRDKFVTDLITYLRKKKLDGVIVFDGGSFVYPHTILHNQVQVIFSGYKEKADIIIMRYIDEHLSDELLIVSSDREIRNYVRAQKKTSMPADEFYYQYVLHKEHEAASIHTPLYKQSKDAQPELDELMRQGSEDMQIKEVDRLAESPRRACPACKKSKQERKQQRITRKL